MNNKKIEILELLYKKICYNSDNFIIKIFIIYIYTLNNDGSNIVNG